MKAFLYFILVLLFLLSCSKKENTITPSGSLAFTTLTYTLTPPAGGELVELNYTDPDGSGNTPPTITGGKLVKNTSYTGTLSIVNALSSPATNTAEDIKAQNKDFQIFYTPASGLNLIVRYEDMDDNGFPLGIKTTLKTSTAAAGNLKITVKSKPDKSGARVSLGDMTNAGGVTVIEINFPIHVE